MATSQLRGMQFKAIVEIPASEMSKAFSAQDVMTNGTIATALAAFRSNFEMCQPKSLSVKLESNPNESGKVAMMVCAKDPNTSSTTPLSTEQLLNHNPTARVMSVNKGSTCKLDWDLSSHKSTWISTETTAAAMAAAFPGTIYTSFPTVSSDAADNTHSTVTCLIQLYVCFKGQRDLITHPSFL